MESKNFYALSPLFDDLFDFPFFEKKHQYHQVMKTDIEEKENNYLLSIDVPGFKKEDIEISVEDGYLVVKAEMKNTHHNESNTYLKKERYIGTYSRSFYVGELDLDCIHAALNDGVLYINIPKEENKKPTKKYINIK